MKKSIAFGSDHGGFALKNELIAFLKSNGYECRDYGCFTEESCDYPDNAVPVCEAVISGECDKGILVCTTGIGICIAANKVSGIRCANCCCEDASIMTRKHNDANVMALSAKYIPVEEAKKMAIAFLNTEFEGGRHQRRVDKITEIEKKYKR